MENEENIIETNKRIRGLMREHHFESGGRLDEWRGRSNVEVDRRKESRRRQCREKVRRDDE